MIHKIYRDVSLKLEEAPNRSRKLNRQNSPLGSVTFQNRPRSLNGNSRRSCLVAATTIKSTRRTVCARFMEMTVTRDQQIHMIQEMATALKMV